jgi:radical SAM protein with 4Fe4S-binding SPASM domain
MVGCPLMCTYCPQDALKKSYGKNEKFLSLDDFKTILGKVPRYVRIDFSGMSEPWANPEATAMLTYAMEAMYNVALYTTLVGMSVEDAEHIIKMLVFRRDQTEAVVLHLPDDKGNMRGFRFSETYQKVLTMFLQTANAGKFRWFEAMTMHAKGRVHSDIRKITGNRDGWSGLSRAGSLDERQVGDQEVEPTPRHEGPVSCSFTPFYDQNVVLPNGDVVLCCMDYSIKHKIGNLLDQDYASIFGSPEMARIHSLNTAVGYSKDTICKQCSRARSYHVPSNVRHMWLDGPG